MSIQDLVKAPHAVVIDVRETWEFAGGKVEDSINIPLGEVPSYVDKIREMGDPIILVCASGNRSGMAAEYLSAQGVRNVYNGGGWLEVQMMKLAVKRA